MLNNKEIKTISNYIRNIGYHYNVKNLEDYQQEVLLSLLEKGPNKIKELKENDKLMHYVYKICVFQILSVKSDFYRKYIFQNNFLDINDVKLKKKESFNEEKFIEVISSLNGVHSKLLQQLIECRGITRSLSDKSDIAYTSLLRMINKMKEEIKEKFTLSEFYE